MRRDDEHVYKTDWAMGPTGRGRGFRHRTHSERAPLRHRDLFRRRRRGVLHWQEAARRIELPKLGSSSSERFLAALGMTPPSFYATSQDVNRKYPCGPPPKNRRRGGARPHSRNSSNRTGTSRFRGRKSFTLRRRNTGCSEERLALERRKRCFTRRFFRRTSILAWTRC